MSLRIVFLDFDGVLNSNEWLRKTVEKRMSEASTASGCDPASDLDPKKVKILNRIIKETGAKVVFSTSWRCAYSVELLESFLRKHGFVGECIGRTIEEFPDGQIFRSREEEIREWLESWDASPEGEDIAAWCAIDDTNLKLGENFVRTNVWKGITHKDAERAIKILLGG